MMPFLTYNNLATMYENISIAHKQINSFGIGTVEEYEEQAEAKHRYPYLWVEPISNTVKQNTAEYKFQLLVFDLERNDQRIEVEVLSDCNQIMIDIIKILRFKQNKVLQLMNEPELFPFTARFGDIVAGWRTEVIIEVALNYNLGICDIPVDSFLIPQIEDNNVSLLTSLIAGQIEDFYFEDCAGIDSFQFVLEVTGITNSSTYLQYYNDNTQEWEYSSISNNNIINGANEIRLILGTNGTLDYTNKIRLITGNYITEIFTFNNTGFQCP